jgi:hypothetical protein
VLWSIRFCVAFSVGWTTNRGDEFRKLADNCYELARRTDDPATRVALLTMAQRWFDLATDPESHDLNELLREFNERQMLPPKKE